MKETDIRPEKELAEYLSLLQDDISQLLDENGMLNKDFAESTKCAVCGSSEFAKMFVKDGFTYVKCNNCSLIYLNPRLKAAELEKYHRTSKAMKYFQENILEKTSERRKKIFESRVEIIKDRVETGRMLDVGCSTGIFLDAAKNEGFEAEGIEINEHAAELCKSKGLKAYNKQLEGVHFPDNSFDIMTMWELIAFVPEPLRLLKECNKIMKKGGFLFLTTPNTNGFEFRLLGKMHTNFVGPNHHNLFNENSIRQILENTGFSTIEISTPGKLDVNTVRNALKDGANLAIDDFLKDILMGESEQHEKLREDLQKWISEHNLSGHMMVMCRKA